MKQKFLTDEKVTAWAYDKHDERKDLFLAGILAECEATAEKHGFVVFDVYYNNTQANFDYTAGEWYVVE